MNLETWLLDEGDRVVERKAEVGYENLGAADQLLYCLWVGDYSLRNAGDLEAGNQVFPGWLPQLVEKAALLGLGDLQAFFQSLPQAGDKAFDLYWDAFPGLCEQVRAARG